MMPCSKFLFLATVFPENVGGGRVWGKWKKIFPDIKRRGRKIFSGHKLVKLTVTKIFPYKFLLGHR
jgi:hypothetical protein